MKNMTTLKLICIYSAIFRTVSQARSYDETTIQPPTKSLYSSHYGKHTLCSVDVREILQSMVLK